MGILISGERDHDITVISNVFIDHFMPLANGAYVKVYLYLLRRLSTASTADSELTVASIADFLGDTEGDVLRAFSYWERQGLLRITRDAENRITGLYVTESPKAPAAETAATREQASTAAAPAGAGTDSATDAASAGTVTSPTPETASDPTVAAVPERSSRARMEIPTYSRKQIQELSQNEEVKWIMNVAERYLERLLNPADIQLIIYLYESVGFPADLILYLYEYCASRDKKNPSYIEAVAIRWAEEGIRSVEDAENASAKYNTGYQTVAKAFGLNRMPGAAEQQFIDRWAGRGEGQFGFSPEIIAEACSRSLLSTQRPDFKYADKILENWHKKGVTGMQDIQKIDQLHNQAAARAAQNTGSKPSAGTPRNNNNRFNAFPQRSYSGEDFSSMEQRLLKRQGS